MSRKKRTKELQTAIIYNDEEWREIDFQSCNII